MYTEKRMNVYGPRLHITFTKWGTVLGDDFKEIVVEKFFKTLGNNLDKDEYGVIYDSKRNIFIIKYAGVSYSVDIDKQVMDQYLLGNYTELTFKLKQLASQEKGINESFEKETKSEEEVKNIIERASKGIISNEQERLIYLEYLKNKKKFSFWKVIDYFKNWIDDWNDIKEKSQDLIDFHIWPFDRSDYSEIFEWSFAIGMIFAIITVGVMLISGMLGLNITPKWFFLSLLPFTVYLIPVVVYVANYIKTRISRLISNVEEKKLLNTKIKNLSKPFQLSNAKSLNLQAIDEMIDVKVNAGENFQNILLKEINALVERLSFINLEDRKVIGAEIKGILDEYTKRMAIITSSDSKILDFDKDGLEKLKIDLSTKISLVEEKIKTAIKKDLATSSREKETTVVEEKLERVVKGGTAYSTFINNSPNINEFVIPGDEEKDNETGYIYVKSRQVLKR